MVDAFSLDNVSFVRQGNLILDDVRWRVKIGENWVLLGANGIGKSTIINMISSRLFPTTGSVKILGETLGQTDVFKLRPRIGILSNDFANNFYADENVLDLVALGKSVMLGGWGDARDKEFLNDETRSDALEQLKLFDSEKLAGKTWGVLSQGEKKRVQMARVLISSPDLLLFDEPTAGLDLAGREIVINALNRIAGSNSSQNAQKPAIVLVNHHVEEIPPSFDKCALMGQNSTGAGIISHQGNIKDVLTSKNLTEAYGLHLNVRRMPNLRYHASASVIIEK